MGRHKFIFMFAPLLGVLLGTFGYWCGTKHRLKLNVIVLMLWVLIATWLQKP